MTATEVLFNTIINSSNKERAQYSYLRAGQSIFNCTYTIVPDIADRLTGTEFDCYYHDDRVEDFLKEVARIFEESIYE